MNTLITEKYLEIIGFDLEPEKNEWYRGNEIIEQCYFGENNIHYYYKDIRFTTVEELNYLLEETIYIK